MEIFHQWGFGNDKVQAERLKQLVLSESKKATTGLFHKGETLPIVGEYAAILDSTDQRFCIIQYTKVEVKDFLDVAYDFIQKEGEGDDDIEEWRQKHREFFNLTSDMVKVVCEEFKLVKIL
jgi:uncharacterized protein YhfF